MPHQTDEVILASIKRLSGAVYGTLNGQRCWFVFDNPTEIQEVGIGAQGYSPTITCRTSDIRGIQRDSEVFFQFRGEDYRYKVLMHRHDGNGLSYLDLRDM